MHAQDVHDLPREHAHPEVAEIERAVLGHERVDVLVERRVVDVAARHAEREHRGLHLEGVVVRERDDRLADGRAVAVAQAAHHAEVEPDDPAAAHPDVAWMRIGMEIAVLDDLLDIVLAEPAPEQRDVDAARPQPIEIVDAHAVDVLHDEDMLRREVAVDIGAGHECLILVQMAELLDVIGLDEEIHLLLGDAPHLLEHHVEVDDILRVAHDAHEARGALQEHHVARHDLVDAGPLHLHDDALPRREHGAMHLRDGGRAEHLLVDGGKDLVPAAAVLLLDDLDDGRKRQRFRAVLQFHELVTILLRQEVRPHAHDLSELDERRPEVFEDVAELLRRHAAHDLVFPQDGDHLLEAHGRADVLLPLLIQFGENLSQHRHPIPLSGSRRAPPHAFLYFSAICCCTVSFARKSSYVVTRSTTPSGVMSMMRFAMVCTNS